MLQDAATQTTLVLDLPRLADTEALAARVADLLRPGDAVLLSGPLGAGKSAFARAALRRLARDPALEVPSPTFTLVQSYDTPIGRAYHVDLWRLDGPAALAELGWDEVGAGIVFVEWPDRLGAMRPDGALHVALDGSGEARRATLSGWDARLERLA